MKLRTQLLSGFGAVLVLMVFVAGTGYLVIGSQAETGNWVAHNPAWSQSQ